MAFLVGVRVGPQSILGWVDPGSEAGVDPTYGRLREDTPT
jgi:hypothetical protein